MNNVLLGEIRCEVCFGQEVFTEMYPGQDGALCKDCYERGSSSPWLLKHTERILPNKLGRESVYAYIEDEAGCTVKNHVRVANIMKYGPMPK